MNFKRILFVLLVVLVICTGQSEARPGWLKKIGKKIVSLESSIYFESNLIKLNFKLKEGAGRRVFKATAKVVPVAAEAAGAVAVFKG